MIRRIKEKDYKPVEKLLVNNFHTSFPQENPFVRWYVLEVENKILGFVCYSIMYEQLELNYVYIDSNYRGQGYATKLLKYMIDDAINEDVEVMSLEVHEDNIIAQRLYKKFGFEVQAIRKKYYGSKDGLLMVRKLI